MTQTFSKTMKAVAIDRFGGIETLETQELPIPAVGADEVLVLVEAAGVGVWDPFEREGGFAKEFNIKPVFPLVLGSDGAGKSPPTNNARPSNSSRNTPSPKTRSTCRPRY